MMDTQPVVTAGWISAAAGAVLALITAFWPNLTQDQTAAILGVVAIAAPVISAYVSRQWAYSPATVRTLTKGREPT